MREYTILLRVRTHAEDLGAAIRCGQQLAQEMNDQEQNDCWGYVGTMEMPVAPAVGDLLISGEGSW